MQSLTVTDGTVPIIELRRPERANAYDQAMLDALDAAVDRFDGARAAVVVCAAGDGAFCGGADLDEIASRVPDDALALRSQAVFTRLARAGFVSVCAVHGAAVAGGLELALATDLRVASPTARFWLPEPSMGLIPSAGGCTRLTRLVGPSRAKAVILGGDRVDATTALSWGLVHRIATDCRAAAIAWATAISQWDPTALRLAKAAIDATEDDQILALERLSEAVLYARRRDVRQD